MKLTVKEAARMTGLSTMTINKAIVKGVFIAEKVKNRWYITDLWVRYAELPLHVRRSWERFKAFPDTESSMILTDSPVSLAEIQTLIPVALRISKEGAKTKRWAVYAVRPHEIDEILACEAGYIRIKF